MASLAFRPIAAGMLVLALMAGDAGAREILISLAYMTDCAGDALMCADKSKAGF